MYQYCVPTGDSRVARTRGQSWLSAARFDPTVATHGDCGGGLMAAMGVAGIRFRGQVVVEVE